MKNSHPYWGIKPDFLKLGQFTKLKRNNAREWCKKNCKNKFISSDIYPWAFLDKADAELFAKTFGGELMFKDADK